MGWWAAIPAQRRSELSPAQRIPVRPRCPTLPESEFSLGRHFEDVPDDARKAINLLGLHWPVNLPTTHPERSLEALKVWLLSSDEEVEMGLPYAVSLVPIGLQDANDREIRETMTAEQHPSLLHDLLRIYGAELLLPQIGAWQDDRRHPNLRESR